MINEHSTTTSPRFGPAVSLETVFYVRADQKYDVLRTSSEPGVYEAFRTRAGCGRIEFFDSMAIEATADTLVITPENRLKRYCRQGNDWTFWWFKFQCDAPPVLPLCEALTIEGSIADDVYGNQCMSLLREDTEEAAAHASSTVAFLLGKWAWQLNRTAIRLDPHREAVSQVIGMMHHRLGENLTVKTMAKAACLSERRFRQVFETCTGVSPKKYYDRLRLETAAQMLTATSLSIAELAETLGYSSQFHFSRAFKAHFDTAPTRYRG